ncbi:MAG: RHS repeat-associated core domain-containing protein [Desulfobacteraceae bacterium]|nr:RHS repeat-associated core domain-containing protein [Desulfobacteraceae bacterium]
MVKNGTVTYFHKDHLGSSTLTTNATGNIVESADYMPYGGKRDTGTIASSNYHFTDQEWEPETGLYNYDARLYDPVIGRFVSADTVVPGGGYDPQMLNRFAYVRNNPLIYVDPDGHSYGSWEPGGETDFGGQDLNFEGNEKDWDRKGKRSLVSSKNKSFYGQKNESLQDKKIQKAVKRKAAIKAAIAKRKRQKLIEEQNNPYRKVGEAMLIEHPTGNPPKIEVEVSGSISAALNEWSINPDGEITHNYCTELAPNASLNVQIGEKGALELGGQYDFYSGGLNLDEEMNIVGGTIHLNSTKQTQIYGKIYH